MERISQVSAKSSNSLPVVSDNTSFLITPDRQKAFDLRMATQIERLSSAADSVMDRPLRNKIFEIISILENIRENCQRDPLDINEESHLPVVVEEMIGALTEFTGIIPHQNPATHLLNQQQVIDSIFDQAKPWLEQVFERMLTNDQNGLEVRARVLSGVFERGKRLHQVEVGIRQSIKEKNT